MLNTSKFGQATSTQLTFQTPQHCIETAPFHSSCASAAKLKGFARGLLVVVAKAAQVGCHTRSGSAFDVRYGGFIVPAVSEV